MGNKMEDYHFKLKMKFFGGERYLSISEDQTLSHPPCHSVHFEEGNERGNQLLPTSLTLIAVIGVK